MASTYSALKVELLETGANSGTWGTLTNVNLGDAVLGEAITGSATVNFATDADVTVTLTDSSTSQSARNLRLNITESSTGVGSVRNLILGSGCQIEKFYLINNTGTGAKTIKNTTGTGISVPAGKATLVYNDGTNVVDGASYFTSLTLGSALPVASGGTGTTSTTFVNLTSNVTGTLPIANGGTGTTSTTFANLTTNVTGLLPVANGGTATATPALVQGTGVTITGTWPNQTINATGSGGTITAVSVASANGFAGSSSGGATPALTLQTSISGVLKGNGTAISAATAGTDYVTPTGTETLTNKTINGSNNTITNVSLTTGITGTLPVANGGTGTPTPSIVAGSNVSITGSWPNQTVAVTGSGAVLTLTQNTSSTSFTVPAGVTSILCQVLAGGGGSAIATNHAGGGGGYAYGTLAVTPGETLTITVGLGGTGGQSLGGQGNAGGTSSIVRSVTTLMSATGGGGSGSSASQGAGGGASGLGIYNVSGQNGIQTAGASPTGTPGAPGIGFPTSVAQQAAFGSGGYASGNTNGTSGTQGFVSIQYVS